MSLPLWQDPCSSLGSPTLCPSLLQLCWILPASAGSELCSQQTSHRPPTPPPVRCCPGNSSLFSFLKSSFMGCFCLWSTSLFACLPRVRTPQQRDWRRPGDSPQRVCLPFRPAGCLLATRALGPQQNPQLRAIGESTPPPHPPQVNCSKPAA